MSQPPGPPGPPPPGPAPYQAAPSPGPWPHPGPWPYPGQVAQLPGPAPQPWAALPPKAPARPRPPEPPLPRRLPAAVLAAGAVAAVAVPQRFPGLGLFVGALAVAGAVLVAARSRLRAWPLGCGAIAITLIALTAVRAAPWVATVNLLAALVLGSVAVSGGTDWRGLLRGVFAVPVAAIRALPWLAVPVLRRPADSDDGARPRSRVSRPVLRGLAAAAGLLVVFGLLFGSADAAFATFAGHAVPRLDGLLWARVLIGLAAASFATSAALVAARPVSSPAAAPPRERPRVEWVLPLATLDLLFAAFVTVQLTVLFAGNAHVLRTSGLTYAEYARQGFWQLLVVAALTLVVVASAARLVPRDRPGDRILLRVLLGGLCGLTLVVLASAVRRLDLYEQAYGLTRLRASVMATLWWLTALFVLVLLAGAFRRSPWLPPATVAATGLALVVFALSDPDARIAASAVHRAQHGQPVDVGYLRTLSADAAPSLARLSDRQLRACALAAIVDRRPEPGGWASWNLARSRARQVAAAHPPSAAQPCPSPAWRLGSAHRPSRHGVP
jgi:hypothetical protein